MVVLSVDTANAKLFGGERECDGPASRHEVGQGAKFDHRIPAGSLQHSPCADRRHHSFVFSYALVRSKETWTGPQCPI
jgi:hypothetical protein